MSKHAQKTEVKPVYYIYGSDDYLVEEAARGLKSKTLPGGFESMNLQVFEGKAMKAADMAAAAFTLPAFSAWRVVMVRGAESIKASEMDGVVDYVNAPCPSTCLIFVDENGKPPAAASPLFKAVTGAGGVIACNRLSERDLAGWIKAEARRQGKDITDGAVGKLMAIGGVRLRDIKGELDKIIIYAGESAGVTEKDVEDAGLDLREETAFGLADAIGAKNVKEALRIFGKLSDEEPLRVLGSVARQMRTMLKVKTLMRKKTALNRIAPLAGVPPYYVDKYVRMSRSFSETELKRAIKSLYAADTSFKTGRLPQALILPRLIIELCGGR